jgi:hypothetical protein
MVQMKNWGIVNVAGPFAPPECADYRIGGKVFGHPRFPDGARITTSPILDAHFNVETQVVVFTCMSRKYIANITDVSEDFMAVLVQRGMSFDTAMENLKAA